MRRFADCSGCGDTTAPPGCGMECRCWDLCFYIGTEAEWRMYVDGYCHTAGGVPGCEYYWVDPNSVVYHGLDMYCNGVWGPC
jgi:hypothetical protein